MVTSCMNPFQPHHCLDTTAGAVLPVSVTLREAFLCSSTSLQGRALKNHHGRSRNALCQPLASTNKFPGSPIRRRDLLLSGRPLILVGANCFEEDTHIRCVVRRELAPACKKGVNADLL